MLISKNITSKTYYINKTFSVSFIEDISSGKIYVLKGSVSELWNIILNQKDINSIVELAKKKNLEVNVVQFLSELTQKNIIYPERKIKKFPVKLLNFRISKRSKNYNYFLDNKSKFILYNNFLDTVYIELNYKCNLKCVHCCNPKNLDNVEINFDTAKKIIDEAAGLGASAFVLTGGECTLNKDFLKIAQYIRKRYLELHILTNAQKFYDDKKLLKEIINICPSEIQVSLYSMNEDVHDKITGVKGSYKKVLEVINILRKYNINTSVGCFVCSYNSKDYKEVSKYAKSMGCKSTIDCKFIPSSNNNNNIVLDEFDMINFYYDNINQKNIRKNSICTGGIDRVSITPKLDITPCIYFDYVLGNYKDISLKELRGSKILNFHKKLNCINSKECGVYEYCKFCYYCPAYSINGLMKNSLILCKDAKAYYKAYLRKNSV